MLPDTGLPVVGLEPFDKALKDFFTMDVYDDPDKKETFETIVPVTGPPVLELGTQEALNPTIKTPTIRQNQITRLPATALTQLNWDFDLRRWTRAHFRKLGFSEDGYKVIQSPQLIPVDILYQFDLWSKYRTTMNQMIRNVALKFVNREVWLEVDLKGVWGKQVVPLTYLYNGPTNLTDIEPKDKDRTVRMVFSFTLHAWIIPDATMIPAVRSIFQQIYYSKTNNANFPSPSTLPPYPDWIQADQPSIIATTKDFNENP